MPLEEVVDAAADVESAPVDAAVAVLLEPVPCACSAAIRLAINACTALSADSVVLVELAAPVVDPVVDALDEDVEVLDWVDVEPVAPLDSNAATNALIRPPGKGGGGVSPPIAPFVLSVLEDEVEFEYSDGSQVSADVEPLSDAMDMAVTPVTSFMRRLSRHINARGPSKFPANRRAAAWAAVQRIVLTPSRGRPRERAS